MLSQCPHCHQAIKLSEEQQIKIDFALSRLESGNLKVGCPHPDCKRNIELRSDGSVVQPPPGAEPPVRQPPAMPVRPRKVVDPPRPPDVNWLESGELEEREELREIQKVLILMNDGKVKDVVVNAFVELFYQVLYAKTATEAIEQMRFVDFEAVLLHSDFEAGDLSGSAFHNHMKNLPMSKRRHIFYVLVGPQFHSLYDLEALSHSANMVLNDNQVKHMKLILKKGLRDNEDLFGPWINALKNVGKR